MTLSGMRFLLGITCALLLAFCFECSAAVNAGLGFTYSGALKTNLPNSFPLQQYPANSPHDFEFRIFDDSGATNMTNQIGFTLTKTNVGVSNGTFQVHLDFGNAPYNKARFLEIAVRPTSYIQPAFEKLSPRQAIPTTPLAAWASRGGSETWRLFSDFDAEVSGGSTCLPANPVDQPHRFSPPSRPKQVDAVNLFLASLESYNLDCTTYQTIPGGANAVVQAEVWTIYSESSSLRTNGAILLLTNMVGQWVSMPLTNNPTLLVIQPGERLVLMTYYAGGNGIIRGRILSEAIVHDPD